MKGAIRGLIAGAIAAAAISIAAPSAHAQATSAAKPAATKPAARARTTAKSTAIAKKTAKAAATVTCSDGTTSAGGRGACSSHGGVKTEAAANPSNSTPMASPTAVAKASPRSAVAKLDASNNVKAGATAKCKDGTYSHSKNRAGACSGHGGVASWN